ncbi:MAG: glycosyltransferase family 4 protein [Bacteroidetes bacterium]|nr:glycosyltransferase family 4 protein [Bacteroidota bacterium]
MKILWLASWYPNRISPFEGDFIQRHALAVSTYLPITVIYMAQYGEDVTVEKDEVLINNNGNLKEIIIFFSFKSTGIKIVDKILYNRKYYSTYKKYITQYLAKLDLPDLIHVHVPMKAGTIAQWIKRKWQIPYIVSEHSATYVPGPPDFFKNRSFYYRNRVSSVFKRAIAVTSVSKHDGLLLKNMFSLQHVGVIHNVVNTECFFYKERSKKDIFRFIHVSVMNYQKNIEGIVAAFAALAKIRKDWQLCLTGNNSDYIRHLVKESGIQDRVSLPGEVSNIDVARQMQESDALVMFSRYENFPCTIIEALCCGLPVIATNIAGIPEAVNASNGILVERDNIAQLTTALEKMIVNYNRFKRKDIAADAVSKYNYSYIGSQFTDLYKACLTQTGLPSI